MVSNLSGHTQRSYDSQQLERMKQQAALHQISVMHAAWGGKSDLQKLMDAKHIDTQGLAEELRGFDNGSLKVFEKALQEREKFNVDARDDFKDDYNWLIRNTFFLKYGKSLKKEQDKLQVIRTVCNAAMSSRGIHQV